jgi:two-component system cell cycle response regulator DivK
MTSHPGEAQAHITTPKTILVVEDDEKNMRLCRDLILMLGFKILEATTGMAGLTLAREHRPDLVLMDIQLPDVNGMEVTKWIKEVDELKSVPVIAFTAMAMKGDEERFLDAGCDGYMPKPVSVAAFVAMISKWMQGERVPYAPPETFKPSLTSW